MSFCVFVCGVCVGVAVYVCNCWLLQNVINLTISFYEVNFDVRDHHDPLLK